MGELALHLAHYKAMTGPVALRMITFDVPLVLSIY